MRITRERRINNLLAERDKLEAITLDVVKSADIEKHRSHNNSLWNIANALELASYQPQSQFTSETQNKESFNY
tara:strand:+ start:245 stop:463 length:219 start_codon:yes stop_codon:yes gene_type:complete